MSAAPDTTHPTGPAPAEGPVSYRHDGMVCTDHILDVPLDHARPDGRTIRIFAREVVAAGREQQALPRLLFLQGGPGGRADRPNAPGAWLARALKEYRVVLLDQRGTGRSTPADRTTLAGHGDAAEYLSHFRADSIVRDAESLRRHLQGEEPWSVLGQSFGGFCAVTYLGLAPEGLRQVCVTGGLPALDGHADDVYRAAYTRTLAHNERYFARYPGDQRLADAVAAHLAAHEVRMPSGERLSVRRFQSAGITFGTASGFDTLHYLLECAFVGTPAGPALSDPFLRGLDSVLSFAPRPLYALLHEPIYAQGGRATDWSAHRTRAEFPAFDADGGGPLRFTGEMIYPWHFEEDPALVPLREAADRLARRTDWPALYDPGRLARNTVPVAAAVYHDDMFVDREHSLATAARIRGLRPWITNAHAHDGLRADAAVLDRLLAMVRGEI
ncbi:alpha/beta fold hydrolase [Streptomyces sp. NPDC058045]|uniref:alpha/beta fold hydrolase n=1 Tax=Streptomyces sp. NPDC058045 TaxID=3346311 RepID=UPI0036EB3CC8